MNEIDINSIVRIESMAVIKQQLDKVEEFVDEKIKDIPKTLEKIKNMSFIEQEDEKGEIKEYKQYLNKIKNELETKRKEIKKEINKPYEEFNEYYSNGVYKKLDNGISQLSDVINEIETLQKDEKQLELVEFFNQYQETYHLKDIVSFENVGLNITLSASEKSLKDQIVAFCERINKDIQVINNEENKEELMLEYMKNGFDYQQAKLTLFERKKQIEELRAKQEEIKEEVKQEEIVEATIEEIGVPQELMQEEQYEATFTIKATKKQLQELKQWLEERNIEYD